MGKFFCLHRALSRYDAALNHWAGALLLLVIRLFVGWQFLKAGMVKISDWNSTVDLFRYEYQVPMLPPELAAVLGTAGELTFPLLLAIGLFSRPSALGLFIVNAMAVVSYPALFQFECPAALNDHFYWGALLLVIVTLGSGQFSLDHWIGKHGKTTSMP